MVKKLYVLALFLILLAACSGPDAESLLNFNLKEHKNLAMHIHPKVEISILGQIYPIPANIGVSENSMRVIHTHDSTGALHVEGPYVVDFYLRDFFTIWEKRFTEDCIFEYCVDANHELLFYVNGEQNDLYADMVLRDGDVLSIVYREINSGENI